MKIKQLIFDNIVPKRCAKRRRTRCFGIEQLSVNR